MKEKMEKQNKPMEPQDMDEEDLNERIEDISVELVEPIS